MEIKKIVDAYLEGAPLSALLANPARPSIEGKRIMNLHCPTCNEESSLIISQVDSADQGFYTVVAICEACNEPHEIELVLPEDTIPQVTKEGVEFPDALVYLPVTAQMVTEGAGLMNGNYLKFSTGVKAYFTPDEKEGEWLVNLGEPEGEPDETVKHLNTRVTYKVISFRNGRAKIISMVNDGPNKLPAGTILYVPTKELQANCKMVQPKQNANMAGRFRY